MKVAIVGSRDFHDREAVIDYVNTLPEGTTVVSGGAKGVDTWAEQAAKDRGLPVLIFYPDWDKHGKAAGPIRNKQIVDASDVVTAFWNGKSRGTQSTISLAAKQCKPVTILGLVEGVPL